MIVYKQANEILKLFTGKVKNVSGTGLCYLALSTTTPNPGGSNFSEISTANYPSYERILLNVNEGMPYADVFGDVANGVVTNTSEFCSTECKEESGWPTVTHFGLYDAKTGGNLLAYDVLTDPDGEPDEDGLYPEKPLTVPLNHVAVFRVGTVRLSLK